MATIKNVSRRALEFPSGAYLEPGQSSDAIPDDDMKHPVVKGWIDERIIEADRKAAQADKKAGDADKKAGA
jgi:hypothetical protein